MSERIHIAVEAADKERYRQTAEREGKTLSVWLREAAEEKWSAGQERRMLASREDLERFFARSREREQGREPDWTSHRAVIEESLASGRGSPT
ncbi:MAG TPA: hypothetical protein VMM35_08430 [Longimicrobiales bacterium]|nr:hypothetical protein [Longimicrobiales bacterium]